MFGDRIDDAIVDLAFTTNTEKKYGKQKLRKFVVMTNTLSNSSPTLRIRSSRRRLNWLKWKSVMIWRKMRR